MTAIIDGKIVYNEMAENARGGTELMAQRMVDHCKPELLKEFNIIHSRIRDEHLREDGNNILVLHDLPEDPESSKLSDPEYRKKFKAIICVSNWQKEQYNIFLGIPYHEMLVIPNGIEHFDVPNVLENKYNQFIKDKTLRFIYHTTPHRGLNILTSVFTSLRDYTKEQNFDIKLHLDVYSSFSIYGWDDRDEPYKPIFGVLEADPDIDYHGAVPNEEVREALLKSHIFAYPSIWKETSCLAAIESLCSSTMVIHPWFGALGETCTPGGSFAYEYTDDMEMHAARMYHNILPIIQELNERPSSFPMIFQKQMRNLPDTLNKHDIRNVAHLWNTLFSELLNE